MISILTLLGLLAGIYQDLLKPMFHNSDNLQTDLDLMIEEVLRHRISEIENENKVFEIEGEKVKLMVVLPGARTLHNPNPNEYKNFLKLRYNDIRKEFDNSRDLVFLDSLFNQLIIAVDSGETIVTHENIRLFNSTLVKMYEQNAMFNFQDNPNDPATSSTEQNAERSSFQYPMLSDATIVTNSLSRRQKRQLKKDIIDSMQIVGEVNLVSDVFNEQNQKALSLSSEIEKLIIEVREYRRKEVCYFYCETIYDWKINSAKWLL